MVVSWPEQACLHYLLPSRVTCTDICKRAARYYISRCRPWATMSSLRRAWTRHMEAGLHRSHCGHAAPLSSAQSSFLPLMLPLYFLFSSISTLPQSSTFSPHLRALRCLTSTQVQQWQILWTRLKSFPPPRDCQSWHSSSSHRGGGWNSGSPRWLCTRSRPLSRQRRQPQDHWRWQICPHSSANRFIRRSAKLDPPEEGFDSRSGRLHRCFGRLHWWHSYHCHNSAVHVGGAQAEQVG